MKTKVLEFPKTRRNPQDIEEQISKYLQEYNLIYVATTENQSSNKMVITLLLNEYKNNDKKIQVKVIRTTRHKDTELELNKFINQKEINLKFFSQAVFNNTIISIVFYSQGKSKENS